VGNFLSPPRLSYCRRLCILDSRSDFRASHVHFSWRNSIELADGTVVYSTGRFMDSRPPGLVVIAIIAILIGLLLPALQ
jgi:hypothetical protein